jgi:signal transduction histidine kinase/CheY-like chemotaxis protein
MLDFNDFMVQIEVLFVFFLLVTIIVFLFIKMKEKQVKELKQIIEDQKEKINLLNEKLLEAQNKLFEQGARTKSSSFIHEQIHIIEDLQEDLQRYKKIAQDAKVVAQEASIAKHDFLSNINHEIRTPMNSILVFSEILCSEVQDKTQLSYANNIFNSGQKLLELLDKIMKLSHLESGSFTLNEKAVDSYLLFDSIVESQREKAYKKALDLSLYIDENLPKLLIIDDEKIKEILTNLIDNAINFTKQGFVKVKVQVDSGNVINNTINISISVTDTGMGISSENKKKIFEIFEKKENRSDVEFHGTGMGLSINRKMARCMNGDIFVESKLSDGSTFTLSLTNIELALSGNTEIDEDEIDFSMIKESTVAVIDSDEKNIKVFTESFENTKIQFLVFRDPRDAIETLKQKNVDLIFMDVELLNIDDGAFSKVIAKISNAPIVSLTTGSLKGISFANNGVKIVGHIMKPILQVNLFQLCIKLLNSSHLIATQTTSTQDLKLFNDLNIEHAKGFLNAYQKQIKKQYEIAHATNDLNQSKYFAETLLEVAHEYHLEYFENYANDLLKKIEFFDIESIGSLMDGFLQQITILKNKVQ